MPRRSAIVRTNRGKALMDEANVFFSGIIRAADDRLTTGVGEQQANATLAALVLDRRRHRHHRRWSAAPPSPCCATRANSREARDEVAVLNAGLEERVQARTADLARANEEIQRFAYIVTHDLRAPLVNIMGFTGELEGRRESMQALDRQVGAPATPPIRSLQDARARGDRGHAGSDRLHPLLGRRRWTA